MKKVISLVLSVVMVISLIYTGMAIPVTADAVQKVLSEELEGYTRVYLSDFKTSAGNAAVISSTPAGTAVSSAVSSRFYGTVGVEAADSHILDKTYLDFDINLASSTTNPSIMLYEKADWSDYLRLQFDNTAGKLKFAYISNLTGSAITRFNKSFNLIDFGRTNADEFFNVKIRADFSANSLDATKRDAVFQLWINNTFADEVSLSGEDMRNGMFIRPGGETIYLREQKYLNAELEGYKRVDMFDFNKTVGTDGVVNFAVSDTATPYLTDFNKTYLDVDLNYGGETGRGGAAFQYLAYVKWTNSLYLGFNGTTKFILSKYNHCHDLTDLATLTVSDFGISPSEYFNVKLRTDIETVSESEYSVTAQLWLNDKFACEVTTNFVYGPDAAVPTGKTNYTAAQTGIGITIRTVSKAVSVKSAADINANLNGYKRITANDFYNIDGTSSSSWGKDFPAAKSGEYKKDTDDLKMSYFDFDIKMPNGVNPFMVWPSKNKSTTTFYGDGEQVRFYLSGTTLKIKRVHGGKTDGTDATLGDISAAPYNYTADQFCNFKIRTNYYGGNSIGLLIFVNDNFLAKVQITTYDADIMEEMTCAGFRGTAEQIIYVRTPDDGSSVDSTAPAFDSEEHIKTVNFSDSVSNGSLMNFDYYIEDLSAPVTTRYIFNGSSVSANSSTVFALAATENIVGGKPTFFGISMTPSSGFTISLFDKDLNSILDYGTASNYPDTKTNSISNFTYTVTAKTESGSLSVWVNDSLILKNFKSADYGNFTPKAAVYSDTAPVTVQVETWCEIDNYNLLGDFTADFEVDILDLVLMEQVSEEVEGVPQISGYVKAFNDNGTIGTDELVLMARYLLGIGALESDDIRLVAPRNGTLTALPSTEVSAVATDYDYTAYAAEQFRELHKDQYYRSATILKWKCFDNSDDVTVYVGTNGSLVGAAEYTVAASNLVLNNLLPDTTYYWKVVSDDSESAVFTFETADTIRTLTIDGVSNTRDIGGYDVGVDYRVKYGMVFRGGKVDGIPDASKSILLDELGVQTDLDLRGNGGVSPLGNTVNYYSYSAPYYWNSTRGINATGDYRTALVNSIRVFANPANYPIYTHCSLGRDRTGTVILLISGLCGVGKSDIYLDYELSFLSEIATTNDHTTPSMVGNHFTEMYNQIQSYAPSGTFADACEAFMLSIGITQSEIDTIRATLIESK